MQISAFRHSGGQCPCGGELPIRGQQWRNTGTHELAQPQLLRKACRCRSGSREGRQRVRRWQDRAAAVAPRDGSKPRTVHEIVVSQCHVIAPVRRGEQIGGRGCRKKCCQWIAALSAPGLKMIGQLRANWARQFQSRAGWTISLLVLAFGGGALALALAAAWAGLRLNDSPSMPTGLYVRTSSESIASLVVFCPAEPFARLSVERGYRSRGNCPDGAEPLAKPIVARAGDTVELSASGMAVNGRLLPNTAPLATDTAGRPLSHWPFGRYVVAARFGMGGKLLQPPEF